MSHAILGPDAVRRDVFVAPSRLARETALIDDVFAILAPWLNVIAEAAEETDDAAEQAVRAVWELAQGGSPDADSAHDRLTEFARECEETGDYDDAATARIAWLAAAWLTIKSGRRLRSAEAEDDPQWRFGGLVNVLALPRLDRDFRELFGALETELAELDEATALDALFPAMEPLLALVAAREPNPDGTDRPPLDEELKRFAAGADIDAAAVHDRLRSLALAAQDEVDRESHRLAESVWALSIWLRMRSGDDCDPRPVIYGHQPERTVRGLLEQLVWGRAGAPVDNFDTVWWYPEHCDLYAAIREIEAVYRQVTGTGIRDTHRPEVSTATYATTIASIVDRLGELPEPRRLRVLYDWISPLLDEVAVQNREISEDSRLFTGDVVALFRGIAGGDDEDADAVHWHLTSYGVTESEDQDPDMHVRSQAAFLAADWLCLRTGRTLAVDEGLMDRYESEDLAGIVNALAWTRSRQVILLPQYVDEFHAERRRDTLSPLIELRAMSGDLDAAGDNAAAN